MRYLNKAFLFSLMSSITMFSMADETLPVQDKTSERMLPNNNKIDLDTLYKKKYDTVQESNTEQKQKIETLQSQIKDYEDVLKNYQSTQAQDSAKSKLTETPIIDKNSNSTQNATTTMVQPPYLENVNLPSPVSKDITDNKNKLNKRFEPQEQIQPAQYFIVSNNYSSNPYKNSNLKTVIPAGSYVKAKVISGAETTTTDLFPVLLQLDYAYQGPNSRVINFKNCLMTAKAKANLSIERVLMQVDKLSCVRENGESIDLAVNGFVSGADSNFGSKGTYISHQDKVVLAALLDGLVKTIGGAGGALSQAQQSQTVATGNTGSAQVATNVAGDIPQFVLGSGISAGAGAFGYATQFFLQQAMQLLPTIGVGSGQDVWVILLDQVTVPSLYTDTNFDNSKPY